MGKISKIWQQMCPQIPLSGWWVVGGGGGGNLVKEEDGEGGVDPQEGGGVRWGRFLPHLRW